jgi:hypothetical protein
LAIAAGLGIAGTALALAKRFHDPSNRAGTTEHRAA